MRIVLIEPRMAEANVYSGFRMPLLGPVYLGTILRQRGHDVAIYNENILPPDYSRLEADCVGISILTATARRGYTIASRFPREKVIIGGVHASLLPEEALPFCRQVVVGEAEELICDLVEGRIREPVVQGKPVSDLDSLPFPDLSLVRGYSPSIVPVSTSRGCPFDCSFCSVTRIFGRRYRFRSPGSVMREIGRLRSREIFFCDDNFCADVSRSTELAERLAAWRRRPSWTCQVRCDVTRHPSLLRRLSGAGCRMACVGLESINEKTLEQFDKRQTVEEIGTAVASFHRERIKVHGMFVLGGDADSERTVWETLRFAVRHRIDTLQMSILTPFPGTRVYGALSREKRIFTEDWDLYDGQHVVFRPKLLSAGRLQENVMKAYATFYSISNSLRLVLRLHIRNAFFRFMGHTIVKRWHKVNRGFSWVST